MSDSSIIKDLAIGSIITGQISEVHLNCLRAYPFIFLDNVAKAEASYDIVTDPVNAMPGKKSAVEYTLNFTDDTAPSNLKEGAKNAQKALSILFSQKIHLLIKDRHGQVLVEENGE